MKEDMPGIVHISPRWRLVILVWMIIWITIIPLFHVHIRDTTDNWSILKSGGAHTVLTPDLPGEFARPSHDSDEGPRGHLMQRGVNSPELGFVLSNGESNDHKVRDSSFLSSSYDFLDVITSPTSAFSFTTHTTRFHRYERFPSFRGPPFSFSL